MACRVERTGNESVMGVFDAPAWVLAAWRRSLHDVGAAADRSTLEAYGERMIERWSAPERIHHNLRRLIGVLARVDELAPETHDPNVVRLAAWYHGAVFNAAAQDAYAHRGGVDEPASAELARTELTELGVPAAVVDRVATLILGIARHSAPKDDIDAQALCDADLGGLAAEPQRYAGYRKEVRAEYAHIPREDYVRARLAIVTKLLGRAHLFQSPMAQDWEDAARENLTAELDRLTAEAARLGAERAQASGAPGAGPSAPDLGPSERAGDGGAPVGTGAAPAAGEAQEAGDGGGSVSLPVATQGNSPLPGAEPAPAAGAGTDSEAAPDESVPEQAAPESSPPVPDEVELPEGGPGPGGFEPRAVDDPGATDRPASALQRTGGASGDDGQEADAAGSTESTLGASIESAPMDGRAARRTGTEAPSTSESGTSATETVAERSQRRWAEHLAREAAEQEAAQRGGLASVRGRRRGTSAPSPLEPGVGDTGANEGVQGATDDFDESSSLSRPPRMPAIKRRPPEQDCPRNEGSSAEES